jgi:hypothetical protein
MRCGQGWPLCERNRQAIAETAVGQMQDAVFATHWNGRKQAGNRRACAHNIAQSHIMILRAREIAWPTRDDIVTDEPYCLDAMVQPVERRRFELLETPRDHSAQRLQHPVEAAVQSHIQAMGEEMTPTKRPCIRFEFLERETNGGVVRRNDGTGARSDDGVNGDVVCDELLQDADVGSPS